MEVPSAKLHRVTSFAARMGEKAYVRRRRMATGAVALLAVLLGFHVVFGQNGLTAYRQKRADAQSLDVQLKQLQEENEKIRTHVERLKDDPNAIEHEARESLHYTRPDEVIYSLPSAPARK